MKKRKYRFCLEVIDKQVFKQKYVEFINFLTLTGLSTYIISEQIVLLLYNNNIVTLKQMISMSDINKIKNILKSANEDFGISYTYKQL